MAEPREPWNIRPAKKRASVTASIKTEVETKARDLIENVLKPKHVLPPPKQKQGNYRSEERRVEKECRSRWSPYH